MKAHHRQMNPKRKEQLWERLYYMDGFGLSNYLNEFFQVDGASWRATQHGEYAFLHSNSGEIMRFDQWNRWRESVSYYFDAMCDVAPSLHDETFCDVLVFKLCRMLLSPLIDSGAVVVHEPPQAHRLLFC